MYGTDVIYHTCALLIQHVNFKINNTKKRQFKQ